LAVTLLVGAVGFSALDTIALAIGTTALHAIIIDARKRGDNPMTQAQTLADKINAAIDTGHMIQISNYLRVTRVTAKTRESWRKAGFEFFKANADGQTLMIEGQSKGKPCYVLISGNKIQAFK
jgi:hypothetical protein